MCHLKLVKLKHLSIYLETLLIYWNIMVRVNCGAIQFVGIVRHKKKTHLL